MAPGPLVHGMTMGEMARYVNAGLEKPARLKVVEMDGWTRDMEWGETGRTWTPPSPNLRTPEAALAYPGTAMFESTNVSEGRGTEAPFLVFGAPWLEPESIEVDVPGFDIYPTGFTPRSSAAAGKPKWEGEECAGIRVRIEDPSAAEPYRLGLELVKDVTEDPEFEWRREGAALTWLLGTDDVFEALESGLSVDEIVAADAADHDAWRAARAEYLIY
jgi:uncharacterized protein YbbC (DUF1343 family)